MSEPVPTPDPNLARWQRTTLGTLLIGYAGYYVCRSNLSVAGPMLMESEGLTETQLGLIHSAGVTTYAIGKVINGIAADRFGGRAMFLFGMLASIVCTVIFGFVGGLAVFVALWALNRLFQSMGWVALVKTASRWFPVGKQATVMGLLSLSFLFGDAVVRLYLGSFVGIGWQGVFFVAAGTLAGIMLLCHVLLRSSPADVGLTEPHVHPANVYGSEGESAERVPLGELLGPLLRNRVFWLVCTLNFTLTLIRETFGLWSPTFLKQAAGLDNKAAAIYSFVFPFVGGLAALSAGLFSDRFQGRHGRVIVPCLILLTLMLSLLALFDLQGREVLALVLLAVISFFLIAPYSYLSGVIALEMGGKRGAAVTAGISDAAGYTGAILSGFGIGWIRQEYGWSTAFGSLAAMCGVTVTIAIAYQVLHERSLNAAEETQA